MLTQVEFVLADGMLADLRAGKSFENLTPDQQAVLERAMEGVLSGCDPDVVVGLEETINGLTGEVGDFQGKVNGLIRENEKLQSQLSRKNDLLDEIRVKVKAWEEEAIRKGSKK